MWNQSSARRCRLECDGTECPRAAGGQEAGSTYPRHASRYLCFAYNRKAFTWPTMAVSMTCLMFFCFINHLFTQQYCQGESPEIYISWAGLKIPLSTMLPEGSWLGCIGKVAKQLKTVPETPPHTDKFPRLGASVIWWSFSQVAPRTEWGVLMGSRGEEGQSCPQEASVPKRPPGLTPLISAD